MNHPTLIELQQEIWRLYSIIQMQQTQISNLGKEISKISPTTTSSIFRGCWSKDIVYNLGDTVLYKDNAYKSLKENNVNDPSQSDWEIVGPYFIDGGLLINLL